MNRKIEVKRPYRHFKGNLYYVHDIVKHTENGEMLVSYQALYPPYEMYVRPLKMFSEKIDKNRLDNVTGQEYRFEMYDGNN